jgi:hypothetical protein
MFHLDSKQMKNFLLEREEEKRIFLQNFDIFVSRSGYLKKKAGFQEIYVPSLTIRISNLSDIDYSDLVFRALFMRDGKICCRGAASLKRLSSLETKEVYLRCIDSAVFGSIVTGLSLMETTSEVKYTLSISHKETHVTAAQGKIQFNVLSP